MRQFVVPQFIEVESKVFGPITVRQFVLLMVALLISVLFYKFVDFLLFIIITVIDFGIAIVFGFAKVNGRPIHYFIINVFQVSIIPKKRMWCKDFSLNEIKERMEMKKIKEEEKHLPAPKPLKKSKLSELSLVVDTGGRYQGDFAK